MHSNWVKLRFILLKSFKVYALLSSMSYLLKLKMVAEKLYTVENQPSVFIFRIKWFDCYVLLSRNCFKMTISIPINHAFFYSLLYPSYILWLFISPLKLHHRFSFLLRFIIDIIEGRSRRWSFDLLSLSFSLSFEDHLH
jgi:hypothetical protein